MLPCPRRAESVSHLSPPEADGWRPDGTCSYCGSMNPDDFMSAVKAGAVLGATDKNYKVYVDAPTAGSWKFYFQHLSVDQQKEFVGLMNAKALKFSSERGFYVLPFFCQVRPAPVV